MINKISVGGFVGFGNVAGGIDVKNTVELVLDANFVQYPGGIPGLAIGKNKFSPLNFA